MYNPSYLATEKDEKRLKRLLYGIIICGIIFGIGMYYILDDLCWRNAVTFEDNPVEFNRIMDKLKSN